MTSVLLTDGRVLCVYGSCRFRHRVARELVEAGDALAWIDS